MRSQMMDIKQFRERYSKRSVDLRKVHQCSELVKLEEIHGVRMLSWAPAQGVCFGEPRQSREEKEVNTYLWVIDDCGIPYIIERGLATLNGSLPKHTNLTGGGDAYIGGEMWFGSSICIFVSGGSGRYPPLCEGHLHDAVGVFESYGYQVTSLGWDTNNQKANRVYRGF